MNGAQNDTRQDGYHEVGHEQIHQEAPRAPYGAMRQEATFQTKSPLLATLLSLGPGLGQIYVGYYNQGFTNIAIVAGVITVLASGHVRPLTPFLGVFLAFYWIYNMIDANRRAHHYNRVKAGMGAESVPDEFRTPTGRGSITWGAVLVGLGVLFILDLNTDISMDWVENWWPLVLVFIGVRLIYKAKK